jgi:DNA repair protein RecN (Recombination protein N)
LDLINALEDKYHKANIQELLDFAESLRHDIEINADSDETLRHLREQRDDCHRRAFDLAGKVSSARQSVIDKVEKEVIDNLTDLGMPKIRFKIQHDRQEELGSTGIDVVTFLFSANSSMPLQNLASTASGGEIARVMLSLKAILASSSQMRTIIFDEIDTGVSGCIAERMAVVMKNISNNNNQVISITHLPQIAAKGDYHYLVYKQDDGIVSLTNIKELNQEERVNEIAHMLSGADTTEAAINNAQALLDS